MFVSIRSPSISRSRGGLSLRWQVAVDDKEAAPAKESEKQFERQAQNVPQRVFEGDRPVFLGGVNVNAAHDARREGHILDGTDPKTHPRQKFGEVVGIEVADMFGRQKVVPVAAEEPRLARGDIARR